MHKSTDRASADQNAYNSRKEGSNFSSALRYATHNILDHFCPETIPIKQREQTPDAGGLTGAAGSPVKRTAWVL